MFCYFRDMLFDQKSPVHTVPGTGRWHKHTHTNIIKYRLNQPRGLFSENSTFPATSFPLYLLLLMTSLLSSGSA